MSPKLRQDPIDVSKLNKPQVAMDDEGFENPIPEPKPQAPEPSAKPVKMSKAPRQDPNPPSMRRRVFLVEAGGAHGSGILGHSIDGPFIFQDLDDALRAVGEHEEQTPTERKKAPFAERTITSVVVSRVDTKALRNRKVFPQDGTTMPAGCITERQFKDGRYS